MANVSSDSGNTSEVFEPIQVLEVWNYNSHLYTLQKLLSAVLQIFKNHLVVTISIGKSPTLNYYATILGPPLWTLVHGAFKLVSKHPKGSFILIRKKKSLSRSLLLSVNEP